MRLIIPQIQALTGSNQDSLSSFRGLSCVETLSPDVVHDGRCSLLLSFKDASTATSRNLLTFDDEVK